MRLDELRRRQREPLAHTSVSTHALQSPRGRTHLAEADVLERVRLEHLEEAQRRVSRVLDVVPVRRGDVACVSARQHGGQRGEAAWRAPMSPAWKLNVRALPLEANSEMRPVPSLERV